MSYEFEMVKVGDHQLGHRITREGKSFELKNIFSRNAMMLGGDKFNKVYFKTSSGNIYLLNETGELFNANESGKRGELVITRLSRKALKEMKLTVGEKFVYGVGITTRIIEIVPLTNRMYGVEYIKELTEGRSSTIAEDFKNQVLI